MNAEPPPATFTTYEALIAVLRARRIELGLSQIDVDYLAGMASGYCAKLESSLTNPTAKNARSIGRESLPLMLGALGIGMAATPLPRSAGTKRFLVNSDNELHQLIGKKFAEKGRLGAKIRWAKMPLKERATMIRKMNQARASKRAARQAQQAKEKAT